MIKVLFKRPVTLGKETFGKGVNDVDETLCEGFFFESLKKDGVIEVLETQKALPAVQPEQKKDKKKAR